MDYIISEPANKIIRYGPDVVEIIRKENNLGKKEDREEAIRILQEWIKNQDHIVKKDFSKGYLERSIVTCKGSLERAKMQIDKLCTLKTLMPRYFQTTNYLESDIRGIVNHGNICLVPTLTKELHRVIIIKCNPNVDFKPSDFCLVYKVMVVIAEYLKSNDFCRGYKTIYDIMDANAADILTKVNLVELQQFLPIITEGYGTRIKGLIFLTESKFIDGFVKLLKPFLSEKITNRIHVATSIKGLQEFLPVEILPEEYGGNEQSIQVLHQNLSKTLSSEKHQELMAEMNKACTDESLRQRDKFNEKYMGMPGTFRTLSLD